MPRPQDKECVSSGATPLPKPPQPFPQIFPEEPLCKRIGGADRRHDHRVGDPAEHDLARFTTTRPGRLVEYVLPNKAWNVRKKWQWSNNQTRLSFLPNALGWKAHPA